MTALLTAENVTRRFGGLAAVSALGMHVDEGELAGLIGPNGAGKTTVFNLLTGVYRPSEGRILFRGRSVNGLAPHQVTSLGIARTFQNIRLFKQLTALDNVKVAAHLQTHAGLAAAILRTPRLLDNDRALTAAAHGHLERLNLAHAAGARAADLPYGLQRRLEVARALATNPRLLLLDEPAAGMNPLEKQELMDLIRRLRQELDLTVLLIEHDMRVVMGICERIYVLDYGQIIAEGTPDQIRSDPGVIAAYLGEEAA